MYHFHNERYNDAKPLAQGEISDFGQVIASTPVKAAKAKAKRRGDLPYILSAMRVLWRAGISLDAHNECLKLYTFAVAELSDLNGELGKTDHERINEIAAVFGLTPDAVDFLWYLAATEIEDNNRKNDAASEKARKAGKLNVIAHTPLFDTADAARAFNKTKERRKALFPKKQGQKRSPYTGLPDYHPGCVVVRVVPDGPGTDRFTTTERKAMARELGVTTETVRTYERDKSEAEFDAWRERRRKIMAKRAEKARKAAEKAARLPRPKRWQRERKPGKTEAVHRFAARLDYSISHAWRLCKDLTTEQLEAQLAAGDLAYIGGYDPRPGRNESDKSAENPAFQSEGNTAELLSAGGVSPPHESEDESDKSAENPAFCCSFKQDTDTDSPLTDSRFQTASADLQANLDAMARLRSIPDTEAMIAGAEKVARWHAYIDQNRASYVYGHQRLTSPHEPRGIMTDLESKVRADEAWADFGRAVGF